MGLDKYIPDVLKIHCICDEKGFPVEDARLFAYVHVLEMEKDTESYFGVRDGNDVSELRRLGAEAGKDGELSLRLKLHTDSKFREKKLSVYRTVIAPLMEDYPVSGEVLERAEFIFRNGNRGS